jgi:glyoxylase-like metal-dependent hydrolase (beta-lactamase superfamily II)
MRRTKLLLVLGLTALGAASVARADDAPGASDIRIGRLSSSCYAAVSSGGGSNAGFIVGPKSVLVIDTLGAPARTERLLAAIARITSKPISALVLTHWHYDHVVGDQKLPAGTPIYANKRSHQRLAERLDADRLLLGQGGGAHGSVGINDVRLPDKDVEKETQIDLGGLAVTIAPIRSSAHSCGDLVVWVDSEKVLYTGDLAVNGYLPNLADAETFSWINVLAQLRAVPAERVVPGHGAVGGPEILASQLGYLMTIRRYVKHLAQAKMSEDDIVKGLEIPEQYKKLGFQEWWPENVRFVYREIVQGR